MIYGLRSMRAALALYVPEGTRRRVRVITDSEGGQAFVEYVLLLTIVAIAVALITQWGVFTGAITTALTHITDAITNADNNNKKP